MKNKLTPEIRFSGFTKVWGQRKLGEISEKVTEKNKSNTYSETLTNSAEFGIINQRDFFDKDISNEKNLNGYYVVRPDDFVYNPRISNLAPVGPIKRNKLGRTGVMSPLYYVFRTHDVDKTYLEKYFSSNSWHIFMKLNGDSGARSDRFAIKDSLFREMPIPFPSIEEQIRVSNFFKQLDETIVLHHQELNTLKQTKQGFLKKMFPKEGESVPEVRFPEFTGDWEKHKLSDIKDVRDGTHDSPKYFNEGFPLVTSKNLKENGLDMTDVSLISEEDFQSINKRSKVDIGDILFGMIGTIGNPVLVDREGFAIKNVALIKHGGKVTNEFLIQLLKSPIFEIFIRNENAGNTQKFLSLSKIRNYQFLSPSYQEQIKIGSFFKHLDNTINLHQRELDALKETKKAFLQKMFV